MMGDLEELDALPNKSPPNQESAGWAAPGSDASIKGVVVITGSPANTKGAWVELIASTAKEAIGMVVSLGWASGAYAYLVDIGIGAEGSEAVIVPDLHYWMASTCIHDSPQLLIRIPAGSRIVARGQSSTATTSIRVAASLMELD